MLGATNPNEADKGSIRRDILDRWQELGLPNKPNVGENGVHASASPFEGLAERINWTGATVDGDPFGKGLLAVGVSEDAIKRWTDDPQVTVGEKRGSLFDLFEDMDADDVLATAPTVS